MTIIVRSVDRRLDSAPDAPALYGWYAPNGDRLGDAPMTWDDKTDVPPHFIQLFPGQTWREVANTAELLRRQQKAEAEAWGHDAYVRPYSRYS